MFENKKGLIGRILMIIGIIILVVIILAGITAYQGYNVYKTINIEQAKITENAAFIKKDLALIKLTAEDCARVDNITISAENILKQSQNACKNPIIKLLVKKTFQNQLINTELGNISISCDNLNELYNQMQGAVVPIKNVCTNKTLMNQLAG